MLSGIVFSSLDFSTREKVNKIIHNKYLNQKNKLTYLSQNSNHYKDKILHKQFTKHKFSDRFINLTTTFFTKNESELLKKGLSIIIALTVPLKT